MEAGISRKTHELDLRRGRCGRNLVGEQEEVRSYLISDTHCNIPPDLAALSSEANVQRASQSSSSFTIHLGFGAELSTAVVYELRLQFIMLRH